MWTFLIYEISDVFESNEQAYFTSLELTYSFEPTRLKFKAGLAPCRFEQGPSGRSLSTGAHNLWCWKSRKYLKSSIGGLSVMGQKHDVKLFSVCNIAWMDKETKLSTINHYNKANRQYSSCWIAPTFVEVYIAYDSFHWLRFLQLWSFYALSWWIWFMCERKTLLTSEI